MNGVEADGIDFILRFRDAASDQIGIAESAYKRLVSAMQEVISTERAFGNVISETLNIVSKQMQQNPYPIVTPLTMSPDQLGMMGQFEQASVSWFQRISNQFLGYINRVRMAQGNTESLRLSLHGLMESFRQSVGVMRGATAYFKAFSGIDFGSVTGLSGKMRKFLKDVQVLVRAFLEWEKVSPEWRKQMRQNEKAINDQAGATEKLAGAAQKAGFHNLDVRDSTNKAAQAAIKAKAPFAGLFDIFTKIANVKWALGGIASGVMFNQAVQRFASIEDAALATRVRVGETVGSLDNLIDKFRDLARQSGYSAIEVGGAFASIAQRAGRVTKATDTLAITATSFAKLAQVAPEYAGQIAGTLVGIFHMTEQQADHMMKMALRAQQGSKILAAADFLTGMTDQLEMYQKAAYKTGMSIEQFMARSAAGVMGVSKAITNAGGSAAQVNTIIEGLTNVTSDAAKGLMGVAAAAGYNYNQLQAMVKEGRVEEATAVLIEGLKKMQSQYGLYTTEAMSKFSQSIGASENFMYDLLRTNISGMRTYSAELRRTDEIEKNFMKMVEERKNTWRGIFEDLSTIWEYFTSGIGQALKYTIGPVIHGIATLLKTAAGIPGVSQAIQVLIATLGALSTIGTIQYIAGLAGQGGILARLFGFAGRLPGLSRIFGTTATEAAAAARATAGLGRAMSLGEGAAAAAAGGILPRFVGWVRNIGSAAISSMLSVIGLKKVVDNREAASNLAARLAEIRARAMAGVPHMAAEGEASASMFGSIAARMSAFASRMGGIARAGVSKVLGPEIAEGLVASLGRLMPMLGRLGSRAVPFAGWSLLLSDVVLWLDKFMLKLGPVGAALRVLMAPFTIVAKLVDMLMSGLWKLVKVLFTNESALGSFGKLVQWVLTPFTLLAKGVRFLYDMLVILEPDLNKMANGMTDFDGATRGVNTALDQLRDKFAPIIGWLKALKSAWDDAISVMEHSRIGKILMGLAELGRRFDKVHEVAEAEKRRRSQQAAREQQMQVPQAPGVQPRQSATDPFSAPFERQQQASKPVATTMESQQQVLADAQNAARQRFGLNQVEQSPQVIQTPQVSQQGMVHRTVQMPEMKAGDVWVPPAKAPAVPAAPKPVVSVPEAPKPRANPMEGVPQASMLPPRLAPPEVNVTVNPNVPDTEAERPLLTPASWTASNVERVPRIVTEDQDGGTSQRQLATMLRASSNMKSSGPVDNRDVVHELQNIARMIQTGLSMQRETKKVPQETPAFNPRFGRLAEGSI